MIDKYKRPRVQRIPPWRAPLSHGYRDSAELLRDTMAYFKRTEAMVAAEVSGAMPGDLSRQELRSLW